MTVNILRKGTGLIESRRAHFQGDEPSSQAWKTQHGHAFSEFIDEIVCTFSFDIRTNASLMCEYHGAPINC
jgi:hypothetical protein